MGRLLLACALVLMPSAVASAQAGAGSAPAPAAATPEALYRAAEVERAAAERIRFPRPRNAMTIDKMNEWAVRRFVPYLERRTEALRRAERAYAAVGATGPSPWSLAAARRVGDLYLVFATELRSVPVPTGVRRDPVLLRIFRDAIEEQARPLTERAIEGWQKGLELAAELGIDDEHARRCRAMLAQHAPDRLPAP